MKGKNLQPRFLYSARNSLRFTEKSKALQTRKGKKTHHHQSSFTTNAKGNSLGRKQEEEKPYLKKIKPKQLRKQ